MRTRTARALARREPLRLHAVRLSTALAFAAGLALTLSLVASLALPRTAEAATAESFSATHPSSRGILVARSMCPTGAPAVVLVNYGRWQDMLGVAPLAAAAHAPVLPIPWAGVPSSVAEELRRLAPERVYVVGPTASLSATVVTNVASTLPTATVERLPGSDPVALASTLAEKAVSLAGVAPARAFVVGSGSFADAMACSAVAATERNPVFAITSSRRAEVIAAMRSVGVTEVVVVGEPSAISASIESSLAAEFGRAQVRRIRGATRDRVALNVTADALKRGGVSWRSPVLASGTSPADLLMAASLGGHRRGPLLMSDPGSVSDSIANSLWVMRGSVSALAFVGSASSVPARVKTEVTLALRAPAFSEANAMRHIRVLVRNGPRTAGSWADRAAANYVATQLQSYGYSVRFQTVRLANGRTTRNVIAERVGTTPQVVVVGAHIDSKAPSPGGNDNGSGVATMLELARCSAKAPVAPKIRFIAFGGEESGGPRTTDHHFGSKQYVRSLSWSQRSRIQSMVSLDMVGYGSRFTVRSCQWAKLTCVNSIRSWSTYTADPVRYERDTSRDGQSDHEAFERVGIPSAWVEWRPDYAWHTTADTAAHVSPNRIRRTGRLTRSWLLKLTPAQLDALR